MSRKLLPLLFLLLTRPAYPGPPGDTDQQADLDRRCEAARAVALAPIRAEIHAECLAKKDDEEYCRRYAEGYNGDRIGGSPRFYELPQCVAAFKFRTRDRN